jgi:hypothetical protein
MGIFCFPEEFQKSIKTIEMYYLDIHIKCNLETENVDKVLSDSV